MALMVPATAASRRLVVLVSVLSLATVLCSYAIARAQSGPSWEVPVAVVSLLFTSRVVSFVLVVVAIGVAISLFRMTRPKLLTTLLVCAQMLLAAALVVLASPEAAAQWPVNNPDLSHLARGAMIPVSLLSAALGIVGALTWSRSSARGA
jgi:hypothetical protein